MFRRFQTLNRPVNLKFDYGIIYDRLSHNKGVRMKKNKNEYTGDLFGVEDCLMCKGTGQYTTYNSEIGGVEYITDCEECGGTGEVNHD